MTTFLGSPRLLKGAIVAIDPFNPLASIIVFQYNLETTTRRLEACAMGHERGDAVEVFRLTGPPRETIMLTTEMDEVKQKLLKEMFAKRM